MEPRKHFLVAVSLLTVSGVLALGALLGDSATFDEVSHLTAGASYLRTADFRLAPDHPPLGKIWCAWPLALTEQRWPDPHDADWVLANVFPYGAKWLFELNDGQRLIVTGRIMMALWMLATCGTAYAAARHLFGPNAGLLALTLAGFCPSLLAHGHLVTTDLPITLFVMLTLLTYARFLRKPSILWLLLAGLSLAGAALSKFSWPLLLPAVAGMAAVDVLRIGLTRQPNDAHARPAKAGRVKTAATPTAPWLQRTLLVTASLGALLLITWLGIWTCYGWRSAIVASPDRPLSLAEQQQFQRTAQRFTNEWKASLFDTTGAPREGLAAGILRRSIRGRILPDAYLLGLASTLQSTSGRMAYLMGDYSTEGWRSYFPIAFAIKTPVASMLLMACGLLTLAARRARPNDAALAAGLGMFTIVYAAYAVASNLNIGHRHLVPLYPPLYALAAAGATWTSFRVGRMAIGAALAWLITSNLLVHPHYLSYFNELVGGPARGHLFLADSNLDWGQDLLRLAAYHRAHPDEALKFAYFGSAPPTYYVPCAMLPSFFEFPPPATLTGGTYVISATHWTGTYMPPVRDSFWTPARLGRLAELRQAAESLLATEPTPATLNASLTEEARVWSAFRLINRLRAREPSARIGYSLFLYKLSDAEVSQLSGS